MNAETDAQKKEVLRNLIIDYYIRANDLNSAVTSLTAWNNASSKRRLVGMYLRLRQWTNAQTALNAIGTGNAEDAAFTDVYQVLINIGNAGGTYLNLSAGQKSTLGNVATGTTSLRHTAQSLTNIAEGTPITLIWENADGAGGNSVVKSLEEAASGGLRAVPNPFSGSTLISGEVSETALDVRLIISDLEGRIVEEQRLPTGTGGFQHTVEASGKTAGVYLCRVVADGAVVGVTRILVQHGFG